LLTLAAVCLSAAPLCHAQDAILSAMQAEMQRARRINLLGMLPYYIEFAADDATTFSVSASLGALYSPTHSRIRPLRVRMRVGDMTFDNSNSIYSDFYNGTRYDSDLLPQTQDVGVLRRAFWLAADRSFKTAIDALGRKRAALRGVTVTDPIPDFSAAPKVQRVEPVKLPAVDESAWAARVRALSEIYLKHTSITGSSVDFEYSTGTSYLHNSEGSAVRTPDSIFIVRTRAARQAPDGNLVYDGLAVQAPDPTALPSEAELREAISEVARTVDALAEAPVGETYVGPVLFEPRAAGQVFAEVFASQFAPLRRPVSEPGRPLPMQPSELEGRIGARVLPEWLTVTDDPTATKWENRLLVGHYDVDIEGVEAKPVVVVETGTLKALLGTRTPAPGVPVSTGHARLPGALGMKLARFSNLRVEAAQAIPDAGMKAKLIDLIKQRGKPYGMLVRKMDFPSAGSFDELRRAGRQASRGGAGRAISAPVLVYKVFPDGREELVRGLRFRGFSSRSFRDILSAGDRPALFDYLDNGAPLALMGAGNYVVGCTVTAPSILFEELELHPLDEDRPRLPVVPSPLESGQ
jgi:hypothetical protein